jgi:hypothetical protein
VGVRVIVGVGVLVGVAVTVGVNEPVAVGVWVAVDVVVLVGVQVPVGVGDMVAVGVGLGKACCTLKLSVFATHTPLLVWPHMVTLTTWPELNLAPFAALIPAPSETMISPVCGLALGPM